MLEDIESGLGRTRQGIRYAVYHGADCRKLGVVKYALRKPTGKK